jgi:iron complex outermembrane receptor protein
MHCVNKGFRFPGVLLGTASIVALAAVSWSSAAFAQASSGAAQVDELVVTASRVSRDGYEAPTPTTVVGLEQLRAAAPAQIADYINKLPALSGSSTPRSVSAGSTATTGGNFLNLRSLGPSRTLVLLDGRRLPPSTVTGNIDINTLPSALVERIDVVTGGASAAWGSDAVAGVVNFVLNKRFTGVRGSITAGQSSEGDAEQFEAGLAYGRGFADRRGHMMLSLEYSDIGEAGPASSRDWFRGYKVMPNPAFVAGNGQPTRALLPNVGLATATDGGLITAGPLKGTQFGSGGAPAPFAFGFSSGLQSVNGSAEDSGARMQLQHAVRRGSLFGRVSYDLGSDITVYGEANYAKSRAMSQGVPYNRFGNITISQDNAYLDAVTRARLVAANAATFTMGRINQDLGFFRVYNYTEVARVLVGADGRFGQTWRWTLYAQHGQNDSLLLSTNNAKVANYNLAIDAVRVPATGAIVCRSTLANPTNGCVPLNVFGPKAASPEAARYILGVARQPIEFRQDVVSGSVRGDIFSLWAGPVSVAAGFEHREETYDADADSLSVDNGFWVGNYKRSSGGIKVNEVFAEAVVPLIRNQPFFKQLDFNGAVRVTDYSSSGSVSTWKYGLTHDLNEQIRLRGTVSRDVRAPNLNDLFQGGVSSSGQILDPFRNTTGAFQSITRGNPNVGPEESDTISYGIAYRPDWLPGFSIAADYFSIDIDGAIQVLDPNTTINRCFAGETLLCNSVIRNSAGLLTQIILQPQNVQTVKTAGYDYEVSYRASLSDWVDGWSGNVALRMLASQVLQRTVRAGTSNFDYAGSLADGTAVPDWRWFLSGVYTNGPFSGMISVRRIGEGVLRTEWGPADITENKVRAVNYVDAGAAWRLQRWGGGTEIFGNIENLFDADPPVTPITIGVSHINVGANQFIYDTVGRQYRVGVRFRY